MSVDLEMGGADAAGGRRQTAGPAQQAVQQPLPSFAGLGAGAGGAAGGARLSQQRSSGAVGAGAGAADAADAEVAGEDVELGNASIALDTMLHHTDDPRILTAACKLLLNAAVAQAPFQRWLIALATTLDALKLHRKDKQLAIVALSLFFHLARQSSVHRESLAKLGVRVCMLRANRALKGSENADVHRAVEALDSVLPFDAAYAARKFVKRMNTVKILRGV